MTEKSVGVGLDEEYGVSVYRPTGWALTIERGPAHDGSRLRPCVAAWLPPGLLEELVDTLLDPREAADADPGIPGGPLVIEPIEYQSHGAGRSGRPPQVRCYLGPLSGDPQIAAAVDLPAAVAMTVALANHNDEQWHLRVLLLPGKATPGAAVVDFDAAPLALAIDLDPLAEDIGDDERFEPVLLSAAADSDLGDHDHADGMDATAKTTMWATVSGLTLGQPAAVSRLDSFAADMTLLGDVLAANDLPLPRTPEEAARSVATIAPFLPLAELSLHTLLLLGTWHVQMQHDLADAGLPDPVTADLDSVRAVADEPTSRIARSGVLDRVTVDAWRGLATDAPAEVPLGDLFVAMAAQTALRLTALTPNPTAYLAAGCQMPPHVDPAWPLLTVSRDLAAHDTLLLRALLGHAADEEVPPGTLSGLLHNLQRLLDTAPGEVTEHVRAAIEARPTEAGRIAWTLMTRLADQEADACDLLDVHGHGDLADAVCALLPLMADAMTATVTADEGSEQWVITRDHALHALLHLDYTH